MGNSILKHTTVLKRRISFVLWKPCLVLFPYALFLEYPSGQQKLCFIWGFLFWLIGFIRGSREQINVLYKYPSLSEGLASSVQSRFSNGKILDLCNIFKICANFLVHFLLLPFSFVILIHSNEKKRYNHA